MDACRHLYNYDPAPVGYCSYFFDRVSCWRPTRNGSRRVKKCPQYLMEAHPEATVSMECLPDGTWNYNGSEDAYKTTYKACLATPLQSRSTVAAAKRRLKFIDTFIIATRLLVAFLYAVSFLSLIAALCIFTAIKKLHCRRNYIHMHMFASFCLRALFCVGEVSTLFVARYTDTDPVKSTMADYTACRYVDEFNCKLFAVLWNYSKMANYCWILVEGLYLHNTIYFSVFVETDIKYYVFFGWVAPWLVMIPWTVAKAWLDNCGCWIIYGNTDFMWIIRGPLSLAVVVNCLLFANIVRELYAKLKMDGHLSDRAKYKKLAKSTLLLTILLGGHLSVVSIATYLVSGFDPVDKSFATVLVAAIEAVLSSIMGLLVSIIYCFCNSEIRGELLKRWKQWRSSRLRHNTVGGTRSNSVTTTVDGKAGCRRKRGRLTKCRSVGAFGAYSTAGLSGNLRAFLRARHSLTCVNCQHSAKLTGALSEDNRAGAAVAISNHEQHRHQPVTSASTTAPPVGRDERGDTFDDETDSTTLYSTLTCSSQHAGHNQLLLHQQQQPGSSCSCISLQLLDRHKGERSDVGRFGVTSAATSSTTTVDARRAAGRLRRRRASLSNCVEEPPPSSRLSNDGEDDEDEEEECCSEVLQRRRRRRRYTSATGSLSDEYATCYSVTPQPNASPALLLVARHADTAV